MKKSRKNILIGSDHAGYKLKETLKEYLKELDYTVMDCGAYSLNPDDDFPEFANELCARIKLGEATKGILICGSGIGMSIAANRHKEIRAALCFNKDMAKLAREHNDANVLVLGGMITCDRLAKSMIDIFLDTEFKGGRYQRRNDVLSR